MPTRTGERNPAAKRPAAEKPGLDDRRKLTSWAAGCAGRVLAHFETAAPGDGRPRGAVDAARAWGGGTSGSPASGWRQAALAAHAAARQAGHPATVAAARAAGHAAATAHMPGHARSAADYAVKSAMAAGGEPAARAEREHQAATLPESLRVFVHPG